MNAPIALPFADDRQRQDALAAHLVEAGYLRCEPALLQPAAAFFESGEDMRGRLYLTSDQSGAELCLRPEYTIPVCRAYLASPTAGHPAAFSYCGPVFRLRRDGPGEFIQAGIENLGRSDREAADAEVLALSLEIARRAKTMPMEIVVGDLGIFSDLLDRLAIPPPWHRRITRGLAQGKSLAGVLDAPINGGADHSGVLAALDGVDKKGARALVEDLLSIAGVTTVGGRDVAEIADRFLEQAALRHESGVTAEARATIQRYLAISGTPDEAADHVQALADDTGLDLDEALERLIHRNGLIVAHGLEMSQLRYAASFIRNLDYYTGFVFEIRDSSAPAAAPSVGGGRYDRLLGVLAGRMQAHGEMAAASADIPAVGAALWDNRTDAMGGP